MNLANNLKYLRNEKGLSLRQLANMSDVNFTKIRQIEIESIKSPTIQTVIKLAEALEVSLDDLVLKDLSQK